jgi:hypothetical protein
MIVIVPTKKLKELLPQGLLRSKDPFFVCQSNGEGKVIFTEFMEYCTSAGRTDERPDIASMERRHRSGIQKPRPERQAG